MLLILLAAIAFSNGNAVEHVLVTGEDRFVQCARGVFGRPVLLGRGFRWPDETIACPAPRQGLVDALRARGILAFEAGDWVHLAAEKWFKPTTGAYAQWKRLLVTQTTKEWGKNRSRSLTTMEQQQVAKAILGGARPPVADTPLGTRETINLVLYLDAHTFGPACPKRKESVVAVWGEEQGARRVVYGEMDAGVYRLLWDSPLVPGEWLMMGYRDVDGDGTEEIVLQARWGGAGRDLLLVIFDLKGREISRQEGEDTCGWLSFDKRLSVTCPIGGQLDGLVEFEQRKDGKMDILVYQADEEVRYRLVGGRYVREEHHPKPGRHTSPN